MLQARDITFGRKALSGDIAYHHAIKVGQTWYEVTGADKNASGAPTEIADHVGNSSRLGATPHRSLGNTSKTDEEIADFNRQYVKDNPTYDLHRCNCQLYVRKLASFLGVGRNDLNYLEMMDDHTRVQTHLLASPEFPLGDEARFGLHSHFDPNGPGVYKCLIS
eukprot:TRINITY_DN21996_c0_g2_i1.p1 TRINITY_DN21996_c0_g2~~TRINITY_DN21996_c0_g2_i1.p1  ORF type:complete len:164 (+),score=16.91 TRINITY_DN21996_c0_g2_i1:63-554(+)